MTPAWLGKGTVPVCSASRMASGGGNATYLHQFSWWDSPPNTHPALPSSPGVAVALQQAMTPEFKAYQQQVVMNCKVLSTALIELGYDIVTGEDGSWWWGRAEPPSAPKIRGPGAISSFSLLKFPMGAELTSIPRPHHSLSLQGAPTTT